MNVKKLTDIEETLFVGWDFEKIYQRTEFEPMPWDYKTIIQSYLSKEDRLLDMGTGGGEFLLSLDHPYDLTTVTESYPPNLALCKEKLVPLGITLHENELNRLTIPKEGDFSIIINRHDDYDPFEVYQGLTDDGYFITQQVGGLNNHLLSQKLLGGPNKNFSENEWDLAHAISDIKAAGFDILFADEVMSTVKYFDLETLVAYASIIKWEFPGFKVSNNIEELKNIEEEIKRNGFVEGQEHRFIIVAKK